MDERTRQALDRLRGPNDPKPLTARRVAAALESPGCFRRAVLDAAETDLDRLGALVTGQTDRQSPFAITRGRRFETRVTGDGMAAVIALVREHLGLDIPEVRQQDLSHEGVAADYGLRDNARVKRVRARLTRQHVARMLAGDADAANLLRHPMTQLTVAGATVWLEQDVLAFGFASRLHVVEIKSYPCIDGRPDADKVSETARQTAVYLLSLMELADDIAATDGVGGGADAVSTTALLITPNGMALDPVGLPLPIAPQVNRLRRQIASLPRIADVLADVPAAIALPQLPARSAAPAERGAAREQAVEALAALPNRFGDACIRCPLFRACRAEAEAQGLTLRLGGTTASACGNVATVDRALALADGARPADAAEAALGDQLSRGAAAARLLIPRSA